MYLHRLRYRIERQITFLGGASDGDDDIHTNTYFLNVDAQGVAKLLGSIISKTGGPSIDFNVENGNVRGLLEMLVTSAPGVQSIVQLATKNAHSFNTTTGAEVVASDAVVIDDVNYITRDYDSFTNAVYKVGPHSSIQTDKLHVLFRDTFARMESVPIFITLSWASRPFSINSILSTPDVGADVNTTDNNAFNSDPADEAYAAQISTTPTIDLPVLWLNSSSGYGLSSTSTNYTLRILADVDIPAGVEFRAFVAWKGNTSNVTVTPGTASNFTATATSDVASSTWYGWSNVSGSTTGVVDAGTELFSIGASSATTFKGYLVTSVSPVNIP